MSHDDPLNPWHADPSPLANVPGVCLAAMAVGFAVQATVSEAAGVALILLAGLTWASVLFHVERRESDEDGEQATLARWSR